MSARRIKVSSILLTVDWHRQQWENTFVNGPLFAQSAPSEHTVLPNKTGQPVTKTSWHTDKHRQGIMTLVFLIWKVLFSQMGSDVVCDSLFWINLSGKFHFVQPEGKKVIKALSFCLSPKVTVLDLTGAVTLVLVQLILINMCAEANTDETQHGLGLCRVHLSLLKSRFHHILFL